MKRTFYIDRQFGQPIWVETENKLVKNITGETEVFNNKMLENYKDKEISFLKEDFEKRMKPSYHCVKPNELMKLIANKGVTESRLKSFKQVHFNKNTHNTKEYYEGEREFLNEIRKYSEQIKLEAKFLEENLNFKWKITI